MRPPREDLAPGRILLRAAALIVLSTLGAVAELKLIAPPPRIVFLRETGLDAQGRTARALPTVEEFCADGSCDETGIDLIVYVGQRTAHRLFEDGAAHFVDARPRASFLEGHVPGALNLPVEAFQSGWPEALEGLLKELTVVVYCDGEDCDSSQLVAKHLVRYGCRDLRIVESGFPGWRAMGHPVATGEGDE